MLARRRTRHSVFTYVVSVSFIYNLREKCCGKSLGPPGTVDGVKYLIVASAFCI